MIRAVLDAGRRFSLPAEVALARYPLVLKVGLYNAERTDHYAHPAADTFILIMKYNAVLILVHRRCKAGIHTGRIGTMTALKCKSRIAVLLKDQAGILKRLKTFRFESFDYVLGL